MIYFIHLNTAPLHNRSADSLGTTCTPGTAKVQNRPEQWPMTKSEIKMLQLISSKAMGSTN